MALALLALGEAAPGAFPGKVVVEARQSTISVSVDGARHELESAFGGAWQRVQLDQPGPLEREYQLDGTDTNATNDRRLTSVVGLLQSPYYAFAGWLRDEASYSRWEGVRLVDLETGQELPEATEPLPAAFRLEAQLRRPEAPAHVWLVKSSLEREGLQLDRDDRNARWLVQRGARIEPLPRWFFPEQPLPFAAALLHLAGRGVAAGYVLALIASLVGAVLRNVKEIEVPRLRWLKAEMLLPLWLLAAGFVSVRLYRQMPHILDAVSYSFQANVFASGALWAPAPGLEAALRGPFEVVWQGRWFSQYPPGAPAAYAIGKLIGLDWLIGPAACALLIGATAWTAQALHGRRTGITVLALGVISPFILFQAGSFLSHPIAGGLLALALAVFVKADRSNSTAWFAAAGVLLGTAFCTREVASLLFGLPLAVRLIGTRRWHALGWLLAGAAPWLLVYASYNAALTGHPALLPRIVFDAADRFGFGDGLGFHQRHTLAGGLANTDELLTLLQLDLFGWLPLFALGLMCVPFLFAKATSWDATAAFGAMAFVVAYTAYFYHGVALGPRYYFEAVPWLLLLAGRGAQVLVAVGHSRAAVAAILVALSLNTFLFYLPAQLARRADYSALPNGRQAVLAFVRVSLQGPRLTNVPTPSLVLTDDWWIFNAMLSSLNCPRLHSCPVVFALATDDAERERLFELFPGRLRLTAVDHDGRVDIEPYNPPRRT